MIISVYFIFLFQNREYNMAQNSDKRFLYEYSGNPEYQSLGENIPSNISSNYLCIQIDSLKSAISINTYI